MRSAATYMPQPTDVAEDLISPQEVSEKLLPWARSVVIRALSGAPSPGNYEPSAEVVNHCFAAVGFAPGLVLGLSKMLPAYQNPFPPCRIIEVHPHGFVIRTQPPAPESDTDPVRQPVQHFIAYRDMYLPPDTGVSVLWPQVLRLRVATLRFALHEIAPKQGKEFAVPWANTWPAPSLDELGSTPSAGKTRRRGGARPAAPAMV